MTRRNFVESLDKIFVESVETVLWVLSLPRFDRTQIRKKYIKFRRTELSGYPFEKKLLIFSKSDLRLGKT